MSSVLPGTGHWSDRAWRAALEEQWADVLERLRLLLRLKVAWIRHSTGRAPLSDAGAWTVSDAQVSAALGKPDAAAETEFRRADPEAAALERSAASLDAQIRERAGALAALGRPFPLNRLAETFGLDASARDVLVLALAPELDAAFERAYAYAHDDATRRYATPALAAALFGAGSGRDRALRPDAPLFRWALLRPEAEPGGAFAVRPLRLEPRVAWYLRAVDHEDAASEPRMIAVRPVALPAEVQAAATPVVRVLRSSLGPAATGLDTGVPPLVNLVGGSRGQATALALAIADGLDRSVHRFRADPAADPRACIARLGRETVLRHTLLLDRLEDGAAESAAEATLERLESLRVPVLLWSAHPVRLDRPTVAVHVPRPRAGSARALWHEHLGPAAGDLEQTVDGIVHHFHLDPEAVARVVATARGAARLAGRPLSRADLWAACRRHGRRRLGGLAARIEPCFRWDDIVVPPDVRRQLEEIAAQVRHRAIVYEHWRFGDTLARGRGVTALFSGPSGTGKTMAAEILAAELELDLYRIDLAGVVSKYIGETEKNLRGIFEAAEESGAILFFDEADALFGKRTEVRDSHDRYANIEVNYLLQRMESYTGLAILATNRRTSLDRAFLRRLRFLVEFPFPDAASRLRIWQRVIPEAAPRDRLDFAALARMELAGGNIRSIAINAAFLAAADGRVITMEHLTHAAEREYDKLDQTPARNTAPEPRMEGSP